MNASAWLNNKGEYTFCLTPSWFEPLLNFEDISNELAPKDERLSETEYSIPSIAVRIPTREVMPIAIMHAVSTDRSMFAFTDRRPSLKFSAKFIELGGI
jgi:hypothetical protein